MFDVINKIKGLKVLTRAVIFAEVCDNQPQPDMPCEYIDQRYCTDPDYKNYMRVHCPKYCSFC